MRDARLDKLAQVIVNYSTEIKRGQLVRLSGDPIAMPLLEAMYEQIIKAGAHVTFQATPDSFQELFFEHADEEQLKYVSPLTMKAVKTIDASIGVWAETNTKAMTNVDPKRQAISSAARKPYFKIFMERAAKKELRWSGTLFPTQSSAQDAEMSLREYENFVFTAGHLDKDDPVAQWLKISQRQQKIVDYLNGKKMVHFKTANGTDLKVNVEGMTWINCDGHENFPDGEVFTGPNLSAADGGVNGVVRYSFPAVHNGREVHDIEFTFEHGRVVDAKASKNLDFLIEMIDQDEGARSVGEVALGVNYNITQYTKNTLFDEKIGGTFHLAVGAGYPETGNANESGLHWDMVCDLRKGPKGEGGKGSEGGGTVTVDGEVISKDGKFVFDGWPGNDE